METTNSKVNAKVEKSGKDSGYVDVTTLGDFVVGQNTMTRYYPYINDTNLYRIAGYSLMLARLGLGPKVIEISVKEGERRIVFEKFTPIDEYTNNTGLSNHFVLGDTVKILKTLHSLGYGCAFSVVSNFGFTEDRRIYLTDHEDVYKFGEDNYYMIYYDMHIYKKEDLEKIKESEITMLIKSIDGIDGWK